MCVARAGGRRGCQPRRAGARGSLQARRGTGAPDALRARSGRAPPTRGRTCAGDLDAVVAPRPPARGARVLREGVAVVPRHEHGRREHAERADEGQLLQEGVVHALGGHDEGVVALAAPSVDRPGEAVPAVPVAGGERRREHVVEVELGGGAVPGGAVVEDHARPQREGVLLSAGVEVIDVPRDRQGREDGAAGAVLDQTVVHKVVREELVGAVRVGVQPPHAGEQPRLRAGRDGHGPLARQDAQRVERVVELLLARGVAREAPADHRRDALAGEGELGRLVVQRRQDLGPSGLALGLVLDLQDVRDLLGQDLLGDRRRQAFEGGEVCLVGGGPGGCVRVRVVRGAPGLREGHVEVARHHRRV